MKVKDDWNDSRELLEKQMDAQDMMSEMITDEAEEEVYQLSLGDIEQLQSDLEDVRRELAVWQGIANKDRSRADGYKEQMQKASQRLGIGWFKY